jgi:acyl-CoA thioesterase-1
MESVSRHGFLWTGLVWLVWLSICIVHTLPTISGEVNLNGIDNTKHNSNNNNHGGGHGVHHGGLVTVDNQLYADKKLHIACVGDSITRGSKATSPQHTSYPAYLFKFLGPDGYEVFNFGVGGATAQDFGDIPYERTRHYHAAVDSRPDVVIIQLGTNDSKEGYWNKERFISQYKNMIQKFKLLPSKPALFLIIPPPLYVDHFFNMSQDVINKELPVIVKDIAAEVGARIIDAFTLLGGSKLDKSKLFADHCHPNDLGYELMGRTVACSVLDYVNKEHPQPKTIIRNHRKHEFNVRLQSTVLRNVSSLQCG